MKRTYRSAGAIVVSSDPTDAATLLLEQVRSTGERQVVAPKGTIEVGESPLIAALREVREEAGLTELMYVGFLGQQRYSFTDRDGEAAEKSVDWFLFASESRDAAPRVSEGFTGAEWLPLDQAMLVTSHAGFSRYLERAQDIVTWREPGRLAYPRVLSDIVWHIAHQASEMLGADANGGVALCGSAARGDFVTGWSDIDMIGWGIDPASDISARLAVLAADVEDAHGVHMSIRLADATGRDASGAGPLYDMKLRAVLTRGAVDVPVIAGTQPLPSYPTIEGGDMARSVEALRDFAVTRLAVEPGAAVERTDRARRILSVMCSAARNVATSLDGETSLRLPGVVSLLGCQWPEASVVHLLTGYDAFRQAGAHDLGQAEALADRVPAALSDLSDLLAGEPALSAPAADH